MRRGVGDQLHVVNMLYCFGSPSGVNLLSTGCIGLRTWSKDATEFHIS